MEELLVKAVLALIRDALPEARVFTETVRQGYEGPAVFLTLERCAVKREMGNRFRAEGEFSLRADPGEADLFSGAEMLAGLETGMRGKQGVSLEEGSVSADGAAAAKVRAQAVGFWQEAAPAMMGKMKYSIALGRE